MEIVRSLAGWRGLKITILGERRVESLRKCEFYCHHHGKVLLCCGVNDSWKAKFIFALEAAKKVLLLQRAGLQTAKIYSSSSLGREVLQRALSRVCALVQHGAASKKVFVLLRRCILG